MRDKHFIVPIKPFLNGKKCGRNFGQNDSGGREDQLGVGHGDAAAGCFAVHVAEVRFAEAGLLKNRRPRLESRHYKKDN